MIVTAHYPSRIFLSLTLLGLATPIKAQSARDVAQRITPSVVLVVMQDSNAQMLSMGSGFVVREGVIATNLHVVKGATSGYIKFPGRKEKLPIAATVGIDVLHDLALLSVKNVKADALPLGNSADVATGDEVYAIGNPQGLEGTFSAGIVSGVRTIEDEKLLQITAPISPGSSGGPVTNSKGEVIGVSVATFRGGQNLNFAIPSKYLTDLLARPPQLDELRESTKSRKEKSKSMFDDLGGTSTDGVEGASFTWDSIIQNGEYTFSLKSKLQGDIRNVSCLVVFYDEGGAAIDVALVRYPGLLPAGLAKRVKGKVDDSVEKLNTPLVKGHYELPPHSPKGKVEFRVLYFQVGDSDQALKGE